jgi:hypothetical protein
MSLDLNNAFIKQYESEVHAAYQRMGSKLRPTVRSKTAVHGMSTTFQTVGKGTAGTKTRNGNVPIMSLTHAPIECILADYYAADYIDKLDELKINHDERGVVTQAAAGALGRQTDAQIVTAMMTATNKITEGSTVGLTQAKVQTVFEYFGNNDVPDDGQRYFAVSPGSWGDLLAIPAFSSADYIGYDDLPYKGGMVAKSWLGFTFFTFSGLPITTTIRTNLAYHQTAIGHAIGADVTTELNYIAEKASTLATSYMSMGAVLVDPIGVYKVETSDT